MPYKVGKFTVYGLGERGSGFRARRLDAFQNFRKINEKCKREITLFEDDEFPANAESIGKVKDIGKLGPIQWKRPVEICKKVKPKFLKADCWLISAIADLTMNKEHFKMVVPDKDNDFDGEYFGACHFRFWQFGKWIDVVIDDRLPCSMDGELIFMNSKYDKCEFWMALLEKAYAKLNGSYGKLEGGISAEALEDFTGGFTEVYFLDQLKNDGPQAPSVMFKLLKNAFKKNTFMGTNLPEKKGSQEAELKNGLICGHSYSITKFGTVTIENGNKQEKTRLIRLRNPWGGAEEWNGDWSDKSPLWKKVLPDDRKKLEVDVDEDGEFWMSFADFLKFFERVELCYLTPMSGDELLGAETNKKSKSWVSHAVSGSWVRGVTAGGSLTYKDTFAINAQYVLEVDDSKGSTVIICLLNKDRKLPSEEDRKANVKNVALNIFKIAKNAPIPLDSLYFENPENQPVKSESADPIKGLREVTLRYSLKPGKYCIIPSSLRPNQEGDFLLRVFTDRKSSLKLYDEEVDIKEDEVEIGEDTVEEKEKLTESQDFFKLVAGDDDEVSWWELKLILDKSFHDEFKYEGFGFSEDVCRSMVALMDADRSGQLGFYEFTSLWKQVLEWKAIFNKFDQDKSQSLGSLKAQELRTALKAGGYIVNKDILEDIVLRYGDKNGEVALDKFIIAALKVKSMIELYKRHEVEGENRASITQEEWLDGTLYS